MNNLKTTNYHKLCAYNPKTDSTLWLKLKIKCIGKWQLNIANIKIYREKYYEV